MGLADFRTELVAAVQTVFSRVSPYESDKINPPSMELIVSAGTFRTDFDHSIEYVGAVRFYLGRIAEVSSQKTADDYLDAGTASSLADAIENGTYTEAQYVKCTGFTGPTVVSVNENPYIAIDFNIEFCI